MLVLLLCGVLGASAIKVELEGLGTLKGVEEVARDGTRYFAFKGIPYVDPPTGQFRFRPAPPVSRWEGVKDATKQGPPCIQIPLGPKRDVIGSEDCLTINVYSKYLDPGVKKPVLFFIHGGAFIFGGSERFTPQYLLEKDIVVVTVQYRLGPFGFLSTEDKVSPGNYGLHDQIAALRFLQDHIHAFGGNKEQVTIMGMSAGGASVHYMLLSPNTSGLFHRAIAMSGSALCWWANLADQRKTAVSLGSGLGCPTGDSAQMLECLRNRPAEEIMEAQAKLYAWHPDKTEAEPMNIWSPRVDSEAGNTAILTVDPETAAKHGQIQPVPFLVGVADSEGAWRAANFLTQDDVMVEFLKDFDRIAPYALGFHGQVAEKDMESMVLRAKKYYLGALTQEENLEKRLQKVVSGLVRLFGDTMFNYPIDRMVKLHANKDFAPVWMYEFNYKHSHSIAYFDPKKQDGVAVPAEKLTHLHRPTHAHEIAMLAPAFVDKFGELTKDETAQSKKFVKLIVDFAIKGDPTSDGKYEFRDWHPVADGQISHFIFSKYSGAQIGMPFQHRMKWWSEQPVYWKKRSDADQGEEDLDATEVEEVGDDTDDYVEEIDAEAEVDGEGRYAESVEELTDEEVEEVEVNQILESIKDEL